MNRNQDRTILVTGATGHQGGAALRHLKQRGFTVRALTRDPDKPEARRLDTAGTEVVKGDQDDPASLTRALDGISGVYSVQDSKAGFDSEVRRGVNVADAANRSRIDHLVYSSVASADANTGIPHFDGKARIEEPVRNTDLRYTILRPVFFMENLLGMRQAIGQGTLAMPLSPETRLQLIAVDDIGAFAGMAFEHPGHWNSRVIELAGDELSMLEIADTLSRNTGHPVRYVQVPWDDFETKAGKEMATMFRWFESEGYRVDIPSVRAEHESLLGFSHWLNTTWQPAGQAA